MVAEVRTSLASYPGCSPSGLCGEEPGYEAKLAYVELMGSRKDPELHAKMFCEGMVQMQSELMVCLVKEQRKSLVHVY